MRELHIIFRGVNYNIENIVDEESFKKRYEPAGWEIVGESSKAKPIEAELKDEAKILAVNKAKKTTAKKFDDGLIKGDNNGKI